MRRQERIDRILALLAESERVEVDELVQQLEISPATARRDLDLLAERGLVKRTHGGATRRQVSYDLPLRYKAATRTEAKRAIALAALAMIPREGVIGLSGGTTTTGIAEALVRSDAHARGLTVVTNAVDIASILATHTEIKVVVTGGVLNAQSYELVGSFVEPVLTTLWLDVSFIGAGAFSAENGVCTPNEYEAHVNRLMAKRSDRAVAVVDSAKYGGREFARIGDAEVLPEILTDAGIGPEATAALEAAGYRVTEAITNRRD